MNPTKRGIPILFFYSMLLPAKVCHANNWKRGQSEKSIGRFLSARRVGVSQSGVRCVQALARSSFPGRRKSGATGPWRPRPGPSRALRGAKGKSVNLFGGADRNASCGLAAVPEVRFLSLGAPCCCTRLGACKPTL